MIEINVWKSCNKMSKNSASEIQHKTNKKEKKCE